MPVGKGNKKQWVRCVHCGKQPVPTKRGRIASHVTPGNQKCIGIGQPVEQVQRQAELIEQCRSKQR